MKKITPRMLSTIKCNILNLKMHYNWKEQITCYNNNTISQKNTETGSMTKTNYGVDADPVDFEE